MTEFIQNFHFLRPWFLLFLIIPVALLFKKFKASQQSSWAKICDKQLLDFLIIKEADFKKNSFKKFIYIGLIFACLSVAGPSWKKIELPSLSIENPNMFVLSLAQDMQLTDVLPNRLERSKYTIYDISENIDIQGQYGLIVYSEEPYLITPITDDVNLIKSLLYQITPDIVPDSGDRLDRAISLALERFKSAGYMKGNIILLCSDVGQRFDLALEKTKEAVSNGYSINIIDASYDGNEKLKLLADKGNGVYMSVFDTSLKPLISKIKKVDDKKSQKNKYFQSVYLDFGYYLVFIPLLCLLLFFRKGLLVLALCCLSFNAYAGFFQNNNQEGLGLFKQGKYEEALNKFDNDFWKGVSLYMLNKHEEALEKFNKDKTSEGLYNKGVTLVKLCKYEEALKAFEESVSLDNKNEDAKYNIEVLNNLFEDAKHNPSLLDCNNNQQQEKQDDSKDNNNNNDKNDGKDNPDSENKCQSSEDQSGEKDNNSNNKNDEGANNQDNSSKKENNDNKNQNGEQNNQNEDKNPNSSENESENESDNQADNKQNDKGNSKQSDQNQDENKRSDASNESDKKASSSNTQNTNQSQMSGSGKDEEIDKNADAFNAAQFDNNEQDDKYDEEAIALQRIYREIPEDVGGLLREFIKREHLKGRYNHESF